MPLNSHSKKASGGGGGYAHGRENDLPATTTTATRHRSYRLGARTLGESRTVCAFGSLGGPESVVGEGDSSVRLRWEDVEFGGSGLSLRVDCGELGPRRGLGILTGRGIVFPGWSRGS